MWILRKFIVFIIILAIASNVAFLFVEDYYEDNEKIASYFTTTVNIGFVHTYKKSIDGFSLYARSLFTNGVKKICDIYIDSGTMLNIDMNVNTGRVKLVLVDGETVITLFENSNSLLVRMSEIPSGYYTLKLVCDCANFDLTLKVYSGSDYFAFA